MLNNCNVVEVRNIVLILAKKAHKLLGCKGITRSDFRFHNGKFLFLDEHLERLFWGASKIDMDVGKTIDEIKSILYNTVQKNKMDTGVHIRLIVSRGIKSTPYQDPSFTITGPTIVVIPEYKKPSLETQKKGIKLVSVDIIRGNQNVQDHRINSLSKFNCIQACIDAHRKGGDEGLMLDPHGYVSTCNSTHFFIVKSAKLFSVEIKRNQPFYLDVAVTHYASGCDTVTL